jgi:N-methylhydantoinase A
VARADEGGALRVGPESAGADPGPVCWGRGEQLTVTDAHLYLGRLDPAALERHGVRILPERVAVRMSALSRRLGISPTRAAEGILGVAEAAMERALRRISVEQGHDPRQFSLVAFGGAGGLHAVSLARRLGCREVLVPPSPGTFSALGLLLSPLCVERTATVLGRVRGPRQAAAILARLEREARRLLAAERRTGPARIERWADLRYRGQAHELSVPFGERAERAFHHLHARRFGISDARQPVEWVALRVRIRAAAPPLRTLQPVVRQFRREKSTAAPMEESAVPGAAGGNTAAQSRRASACWDGSWRPTLVVPRPALRRGRSLSGPALIVDYSGTTALPPGARARHGPHGVLLVKP